MTKSLGGVSTSWRVGWTFMKCPSYFHEMPASCASAARASPSCTSASTTRQAPRCPLSLPPRWAPLSLLPRRPLAAPSLHSHSTPHTTPLPTPYRRPLSLESLLSNSLTLTPHQASRERQARCLAAHAAAARRGLAPMARDVARGRAPVRGGLHPTGVTTPFFAGRTPDIASSTIAPPARCRRCRRQCRRR